MYSIFIKNNLRTKLRTEAQIGKILRTQSFGRDLLVFIKNYINYGEYTEELWYVSFYDVYLNLLG